MAVGDRRHYVVDTVMPRHFIQTAAQAGIGASIPERVFAEILASAPAAIEQVTQSLPAGYPEEIAASIITGFEGRLRNLSPSR